MCFLQYLTLHVYNKSLATYDVLEMHSSLLAYKHYIYVKDNCFHQHTERTQSGEWEARFLYCSGAPYR